MKKTRRGTEIYVRGGVRKREIEKQGRLGGWKKEEERR